MNGITKIHQLICTLYAKLTSHLFTINNVKGIERSEAVITRIELSSRNVQPELLIKCFSSISQ